MKLYNIVDFVPVPTEEWMAMEAAQKLYHLVYNKGPGDADGRKRVRGTKEMVYKLLKKWHLLNSTKIHI